MPSCAKVDVCRRLALKTTHKGQHKSHHQNLNRIRPFIFGMLAILLGAVPSLRAQVNSAALSGFVQDQTGAAISGAAVTVEDVTSAAQRTTTTNGTGNFTFAGLPAGDYNLTIAANGFKNFV